MKSKELSIAIKIASEAHLNQMDKGGNPYILHPIWVMNKVRHLGHEYMIVGVLHDVVEDSNWSISKLRSAGIPEVCLVALALLTHDPDMEYQSYIKSLAVNEIAREVKMRDLEHNSKITRLKGLRDKDFERMKKYNKAYTYLKEYKYKK